MWDTFISESKNGVFLFYRDYMEYHSDRFSDYSLLFFDDKTDKLLAVMPANITGDIVYSHAGLTFGGIVSGYDMKTHVMMEIFSALIDFLRREGVSKLIYKAIPKIYHLYPAEEDLYALFRYGAQLIRRDITSSIYLPSKVSFDKNRIRSVKKGLKNGIVVKRSYDFRAFMSIVEEVLRGRHNTKPVHTAEEMELLASRFPDNIKLFAAYKGSKMLAGTIIYESNKNVAHAQYIANSKEGMKLGALDVVFDYLIDEYYPKTEKIYFDFGISTENEGNYLNVGLIRYKEGFGARGIVHDFYEVIIK